MSIETGYELIDAIINNPIQAIFLFGIPIIIYKLFFTRNGFFGDEINHLKYYWKRDLDQLLENLLDWLDRRDKAYQDWAKQKTKKQFLKYELMIWSCLFMPLIIWNMLSSSELQVNTILFYIMIAEYVGIISFTLYRYKKPKKPKQEIKKIE